MQKKVRERENIENVEYRRLRRRRLKRKRKKRSYRTKLISEVNQKTFSLIN